MKFFRVVGSVIFIASISGAASGIDTGTAMSGVCALITRQEAATALGTAVPPGVEKDMDFPMQERSIKTQSCFFGTEVSVTRFEFGGDGKKLFAMYRESLAARSDFQDLKGLGDEAFAAKGQLSMRKGGTAIIIDVGQARGGGAKELAAEKTLASLVLSRM